MALAFLIAILVLASASAIAFSNHWLPALATRSAAIVDQQLLLNLVVLGIVFILAQLTLAVLVWRFREGAHQSEPKRKPTAAMEIAALVIATILFMGLNTTGLRAWLPMAEARTEDPLVVEVTAVQFQWYFRYSGPDRRFGITRPELVDASEGNPLGIDRHDPASADDVVTSKLVLPEDSDVELRLKSQDVIHSLFIPGFRLKRDAVPGMTSSLRMHTGKAGVFDIACAELCGMGHYKMAAKVEVIPKADYAMVRSMSGPGR